MKITPTYTIKCETCGVRIGARGEGPAYASERGTWECSKHIDKALRQRIDGKRRKPVTVTRGVARAKIDKLV